MRDYEVVYIFDSALGEESIDEKVERYNGMLTASEGAEVKAVDRWGKRQLAYPIRKKPNGYYVVAQLHTDPVALPEFERALKLDEEVLRYLIVLHEGEPTGPITLSTREPREASDDEEEE